MIGRILAGLVGAEMQRSRQGSGVKGAVLGMAAMGVLRRLGPVGMAIGGAYAAKKMYDRHQAEKAANSTT